MTQVSETTGTTSVTVTDTQTNQVAVMVTTTAPLPPGQQLTILPPDSGLVETTTKTSRATLYSPAVQIVIINQDTGQVLGEDSIRFDSRMIVTTMIDLEFGLDWNS